MTQQEFKKSFHHTYTFAVEWGHMDALGHVNNAQYLSYYETARINYLEQLMTNMSIRSTGTGPILAHIACDFKRPIIYPDVLHMGSRISSIGNTSMKLYHAIWSQDQQEVVNDCTSVLVMFDYHSESKMPVDQQIRDAFARYNAGEQNL